MKIKLLKMPYILAVFFCCLSAIAKADEGPKGGSPEQALTQTIVQSTLSAKGAQDIADAIVKFALDRKQSVTLAIVDAGGNLLLFKRMDGAGLGTISAAIKKAESALKLQAPTQVFANMADSNLGLALGFLSIDMSVLGGGMPIVVDGVVVGGLAVSGGSGGEDDLYNQAGLAALKNQ